MIVITPSIDKRFNRTAIEVKNVSSQTFDEEFADARELLAQGKQVLILTTYQTVGSEKNIQYPIPEGQEDTMVYDPTDTRKLKDFEAIYVCTLLGVRFGLIMLFMLFVHSKRFFIISFITALLEAK